MTATVRLSNELEAVLTAVVKVSGKRRSEIIREALSAYCELLLEENRLTMYDQLTKSDFKPANSGLKDLSTNPEYLKKVINERNRRSS